MTSLRVMGLASSLRFWRRRLDRPARLAPGAEAAADMGDRLKPHVLGREGGQCRALAGGTEEHEAPVLGEDRLVILALRVDPEFQHAARTMEGAGNAALAVELADVADVDEHGVAARVQLDGVGRRKRLDLAFGGLDQGVDMGGDVLRHGLVSVAPAMVAEGMWS